GTNAAPGYATVKYAPSGEKLWIMHYTGPGNGPDIPVALALDSQGNVYVTGSSLGDGTGYDFATVKYVKGPQLTSELMSPSGQFRFTLLGEAGRTYAIQASIDLKHWETVTSLFNSTGTNQFMEPATNSKPRFYRAVATD